jgi:hypothetical protein
VSRAHGVRPTPVPARTAAVCAVEAGRRNYRHPRALHRGRFRPGPVRSEGCGGRPGHGGRLRPRGLRRAVLSARPDRRGRRGPWPGRRGQTVRPRPCRRGRFVPGGPGCPAVPAGIVRGGGRPARRVRGQTARARPGRRNRLRTRRVGRAVLPPGVGVRDGRSARPVCPEGGRSRARHRDRRGFRRVHARRGPTRPCDRDGGRPCASPPPAPTPSAWRPKPTRRQGCRR